MCFRMCSVLALLTAYQIEQGFQEVKNYAQTHEVLLPRVFTYFSSFWLIRNFQNFYFIVFMCTVNHVAQTTI
ncbi:unnamed protein product [Macrosiphum euphorbiae]|uniref:Secreted protein n=1 Tax=Macrosiphum euphorbiae TaxID=13131 RepID=A0AAV0W9L2_9HEMI|nr:unnamed protein product [Macrosiphum euphorbiae]